MEEVKYTVRVNYKNGTQRFVKWCDEHWFETTNKPNYAYSLKDAQEVRFFMGKHYIPNTSIIGSNGSEVGIPKIGATPTPVREEARKNIFTLNKNILKK